jgi:bifunctional non-homologous end joining protein LigD
VLASTLQRDLAGIVAKRLDSPYKPGARNGAWIKHKHHRSERFLITAWAPAQPSRPESFFLREEWPMAALSPPAASRLV